MKNKKVKLGDYIEEYSVKNKQGKEYPVYSVTNSNGFCTEYFNKDVSSKDKRNYKIVPYGCFAYNPSRINVGSIDWQHYEKNVIVSPLYIVFKCSNKIKQKYLQYFFESEYGKHLINSKVSGSVRANLKFSSMCDFELNIGTIEEQQKIISTIDKINKLINAQKQQLEKLDELVKSKFNEMFINNSYKKVCLNDIAYSKGQYGSGASACTYEKSLPRYIRITDINSDGSLNDSFASPKDEKNLDKYTLYYGDILFARTGATVGKTYLYNEKDGYCIYAGYCIRFKLNMSVVNPHYIFSFTQTDYYKNWIKSKQRVVAQPNINAEEYGQELSIPLPPLSLQNKFAEFVKKVENIKANIQKQIGLYTELLNKKMDEYFN